MKKVLFIFLLTVHLLGNTDILQLFHLPMLIVHYQHHLRDNSTLKLVDFLSTHYGPGDGINSDDNEEKQMPFMQSKYNSLNIVIVSLPNLSLLPHEFNPLNIDYAEYFQSYIPNIHSLSLLRPPIINS